MFRAGRAVLRWHGWAAQRRLLSVGTRLQVPDFSWNYEEEKKNFKLTAPEYYNFSRDVVDKWAHKEKTGERGNNPALWWINESGGEKKFSYQDISYQSKLVANVLAGPCNLKEGDVAILILPRIPEWWFINVAAIRAGVILSSGTTLLRPSDIKYRLNVSEAKCIITNSDLADFVDEVADMCPSLETKVLVGQEGSKRHGWLSYEDLVAKSTDSFECVNSKASDPMTIFFTSGTTGAPKMTEHTHSSYGLGHAITANYFLGLTPDDVLWNLSDTGWAKCAWSSLFSPFIAGACSFVQDSGKFDPHQTLEVLTKYPVSHFCSAPTGMRFMVKQKLSQYRFVSLAHCVSAGEPVILSDFPISVFCAPPTAVRLMQTDVAFSSFRATHHLQHIVAGGEPVNPELLQEWNEGTGLTLYEGYGQTETTLLCATYPSIEQRPGSMGKPAPGINLEIVDDDGQILPSGQEGNIAVRCKPERPVGLFSRYIADDERMRKSFVGDFFLTGDRASMDDRGYVWFKARSDDVILSSGYRIGPFEVESALLEHPAVLESAVVSSPDKYRGEVVKAFVTLTSGYLDADKESLVKELQDHTKHVTAPYKYPRKIEFVDVLPKTISGKIRRVELREQEWAKKMSK